jgi:malate permease and related proteins
MDQMGNIIFNVISPIFLVIGVAALVGRTLKPDPRTLSTFLVYMFSPALVFRGFATLNLQAASVAGVAGVAIAVPLAMMVIGVAIAAVRPWPPERKSAFILCLFMMNAANYGIPLNKFAFGPEAESLAVLYYSVQIIPGNILGIYFASKGAVSTKQAVLNVLKVPLTYAAALGILVNPSVGLIVLPVPVMRATIEIAANAPIPMMLALLGLKLAETHVKGMLRPVLMATALRLMLAPLVALPFAHLFGLTGLPFKVAIVQSATPTAALAGALTTEFGSDSEFTSAVIFMTTLVSVLTLTILLSILGTG